MLCAKNAHVYLLGSHMDKGRAALREASSVFFPGCSLPAQTRAGVGAAFG